MTGPRVPHEDNPRDAARRGDKRSKKHDHATCDRPPTDVDGLVGAYDRVGGHRHAPYRLGVRWAEVVTDTIGNPIKLKKYNLEWQNSKDGGASWRDAGRARVPAKNDDDSGTKDHFWIQKIKARLDYRFRVQAEATGGCRSAWSGWLDVGSAVQPPPEPTEVTLDIDEHTAHGSWKLADDSENATERDIRITHVEWELFKGPIDIGSGGVHTFTVASQAAMLALNPDQGDVAFRTDTDASFQFTGNNPNQLGDWTECNEIAADKMRVATHFTTKLHRPPANRTFNLRVRTVSADGVPSDWVSTSATKNTPSTPAGPTITFDAQGPRHSRFRALVAVSEVADTDFEVSYYRVQFVHKRTSGTPSTNDDRQHHHVKAKGTNHELTTVFRGIPINDFTYAREQAVDKDGKESAWSSWTAGGKPSASDTVPALTSLSYLTNRRRVGIKWVVPLVGSLPDERIAHINGEIATDNGFVSIVDQWHSHAGHGSHRYAIPVNDPTTQFYVRVRTLDAAGNVGAWQPSDTGHLLDSDPDSGGGSGSPVGAIHHFGGKLAKIPPLWLLCDGSAISRSTYSELFTVIGTLYGSGDGSTTFNIPDIRSRHMLTAATDAEAGLNDGLGLASRNQDHNVHGDHPPTHGTHAHGAHDDHNSHRTDNVGEASHGHYISGWNTDSSASVGRAIGNAGAAPQHQHGVPNHSTASGANHNHQHNVGHDDAAGSRGHQQHGTHDGHQHNEHGSGEHDSNRPAGQGHRPHPHHKFHAIIKAQSG